MPDLTPAHRGYEYQDLLVACRLIDVVLGQVRSVNVDEKLVVDDRFDDLTTVDENGVRERTQFKHTDNDDAPLTLDSFTTDRRGLRLDKLVAAAVAERDGPGAGAPSHAFRIVVRNTRPIDTKLLAVLRPAAVDPGPFQPEMLTYRMRFDAEALREAIADSSGVSPPFAFLGSGETRVDAGDLAWLCDRLTVEVEAPAASWDLTAPGPAEALLIHRVRAELGAEIYPNQYRAATDVADAIVRLARSARQRRAAISRDEILRRTQLRHDFGAVARAHPVDPALSVDREDALEDLTQAVTTASESGGVVVVTAPPGQGKSWLCQQLTSALHDAGWLVAEHYCYLGDADGERLARVLSESLFGSLLARVGESDPTAVAAQRPLLAATEEHLTEACARAIERDPTRPVALIVDGIDHVTRIRSGSRDFDPSRALSEALAGLELPTGSVLVVLSQPGGHLDPLLERSPLTVTVPGLSGTELGALATAFDLLDEGGGWKAEHVTEEVDVDRFLAALSSRSGGNALYATYLCREILRDPAHTLDPLSVIERLPSFDGSLENYYQHLWRSLEDRSWWVAEVIALLDFAVTREELREIRPDLAPRVDAALDVLAPVLVERNSQGGLRIYHESFGRFLRRPLQSEPAAMAAVLGHVATWLEGRGLFDDSRAFRSLLPILAQAGRHQEVVDLIDANFVTTAVGHAMPVSAIHASLANAVASATALEDWPTAIRCVELARAATTLEQERYESTLIEHVDVVAAVVGLETIADRLLHEGLTVMAARAGLQMCAAIDELGGVPPWREYLTAYIAEDADDDTSYDIDTDRAVGLAILRGRLRLSAASGGTPPLVGDPVASTVDQSQDDVARPINWGAVAAAHDEGALPTAALVRAIDDTYGAESAAMFTDLLTSPGHYMLCMAEAIVAGRMGGDSDDATELARLAVEHGVPAGNAARLIALGVEHASAIGTNPYEQSRLLDLTHRIQGSTGRWEPEAVREWLDTCAVAAAADPLGLNAAEAMVSGPGWYPCWLRFTVELARLENGPAADRDSAVERALGLLAADLEPFAGDPRSSDLYPIHGPIQSTVRRALALVSDDAAWERSVDLILHVGDALATSISGELGGPLPSDRAMRMVLETSSSSRLAKLKAVALAALDAGGGSFYSDVAETRLVAARVALMNGNTEEARSFWLEACQLLVAYGFHKDITIYELLDPFPALIKADPRRARERLPALQALSERVWNHTDGKETRHALARCWELIAAADPAALASIVAPALLAHCNDSSRHLNDALADLWRSWSQISDPFVSAALRVTLDAWLDRRDPTDVERLVGTMTSPHEPTGRLLSAYLARVDERSTHRSVSNSGELIAADDRVIADINAAASPAGLPTILPLPALTGPRTPSTTPHSPTSPRTVPELLTRVAAIAQPAFGDGSVGLARAVRSWQSRPYEDPAGAWSTDRSANVLGYRLLELAQAGRQDEAADLLHQVADGVTYGRGIEVLASLSEGLSLRGETTLAAVAGALTWTRARGHGGWLTFGGETQLDALRRAAAGDSSSTLVAIGEEIQQLLRRGSATFGVSQAIIQAFGDGALTAGTGSATDSAFACFDAALGVIDARAPRVGPHDDPDLPYTPPPADRGEAAPGDLDAALATAAFAGLAHPERDAKRRAIVAVKLLVAERPEAAADAVRTALTHLSDPATLTWLLSLLEGDLDPSSPALSTSTDILHEIASRPHLAVRALARSLSRSALALPPPGTPDPELVSQRPATLWTPTADATGPSGLGASIVDELARARLHAAEGLLPGLTAAVVRRANRAVGDTETIARMRHQGRALADRRDGQWPDAFLAVYEVTEDALQRAAAGARAADLLRGTPHDPARRESELAAKIVDRPHLAAALEGTRMPRPEVPAPPSRFDPIWRGVGRDPAEIQTDAIGAAYGTGPDPTTATLESVLVADFGQLAVARRGWRVLASEERLISSSAYGDDSPDVVVRRLRGIEVGRPGDTDRSSGPPFMRGDILAWGSGPYALAGTRSGPLAGLDNRFDLTNDSRRGLGLPDAIVTPTRALLSLAGVESTSEWFELGDRDGPLIALCTWRALYESSDYHMPWPRLTGSALLVNRRAFDRIVAGSADLVMRDHMDLSPRD